MKENFDDILKRKWEEKQFPMDEQHRAEMISLLDTKKRRRILPFWWLGGAMVVSAVAGFFFFLHYDKVRTESLHQDQPIREEKASPTNGLASGGTAPNEVLTNSNTTSTEPSTAKEATSTTSSSFNSSISETLTSELNNSTIPYTSDATLSNPSKTSAARSTSNNKSKTATNTDVKSGDSHDNLEKQTDPASQEYFLVEDAAIQSIIVTTEPVAVTIVAVEDERIATDIGERSIIPSPFLDPLLVEGIQHTSDTGPGIIKAQTSFKKSLYLFGETGAGMIFASKPDYTSGWKLRAGAGLGFKLTPKVQLSWSLGYLMQDGGFDFERTSTVNQAGFGVRSSFNTLTPERLHFVYTRFGMHYRMYRHLLGIHGGIQYLYGAQGTIVIQKQDQFSPDVTETSANIWVNTNGLRRWNWAADVSYGYQLTPRLSAIIGTDIYFSSITASDAMLAQEGYTWNGSIAALHPFITLDYLIYGR